MFKKSLRQRIEQLEHRLDRLENHQHATYGDLIPQPNDSTYYYIRYDHATGYPFTKTSDQP